MFGGSCGGNCKNFGVAWYNVTFRCIVFLEERLTRQRKTINQKRLLKESQIQNRFPPKTLWKREH